MSSPLRTIVRAKKRKSRAKVKAAQRKLQEILMKKYGDGPKVQK